jgi:purine-binding chemotaxis protein CheW
VIAMSEPTGALASSPAAPAGAPERRACVFTLAGARFAVDVRSTRELAMFHDITRVPCAPTSLVGVANLRGTVMPIVDIRRLLDLPAERSGGGSVRTLVLRADALQAAVVVDAVLDLEPFDEIAPVEDGDRAGDAPGRRFTAGYVTWDGERVGLLDAPKILEALMARPMRTGRGAVEG